MHEVAYLLALANKIAAENGLAECATILAKLDLINPDTTPAEIMDEMREARASIEEHQNTLREILKDSNSILAKAKAPTN